MANFQNPAYITPTYTGVPITADNLGAVTPLAVRMQWQSGFDVFETLDDFFAPMEGPDDTAIIHTIEKLSAGRGAQITFTIASALTGEPHFGSSYFTDASHYEQIRLGTNTLWVDYIRHGIKFDERTAEIMGIPELDKLLDEMDQGLPGQLGSWAGRMKSEQLFMMFRETLPSNNVYPLTSPLGWFTIVNLTPQLQRQGAKPAMVGRDPKGEPVEKFVVVVDSDGVNSLENDNTFIAFCRDSKDVDGCKYAWSGGWPNIRGHSIKVHKGLFNDGPGAQGSPLKPMGVLGAALTIVSNSYNAVQTIFLGGTDYDPNEITMQPSKWFPNYAYTWGPGTLAPGGSQPAALVAGTLPFYVAIVNPLNAVTDGGKWGLYQCIRNTGKGLVISRALVDGSVVATHASGTGPALTSSFVTTDGSQAGGDSIGTGAAYNPLNTIVTGVNVTGLSSKPGWTWSTGSTGNSNTHPEGALVYYVGPDARALFNTLILAADSTRRGYGKYRGRRSESQLEGDFVQMRYFATIMGQNLRANRLGVCPGALRLVHTGNIQGTPLPPA